MSVKQIHYVNAPVINFFIANCSNIDCPIAHCSIDILEKNKYNFGIILGAKSDDPVFRNISVPTYSPTNGTDYFSLDFVQRKVTCNNFASRTKKYRFLFIDIEKLAEGKFSQSALEKYKVWFDCALVESHGYDAVYIVTSITPFYYHVKDPTNEYINGLLTNIDLYPNLNLVYLSTDNDHFSNIVFFKSVPSRTLGNRSNIILTGKIARVQKKPEIFFEKVSTSFPDGFYIADHNSGESGFAELTIGSKINNINYRVTTYNEITSFIMKQVIEIVYEVENKTATVEQVGSLNLYKRFMHENNTIGIHQRLLCKNKISTEVLRKNFLDGLISQIKLILGE